MPFPKRLPLQPEYLAERIDPLHRHKDLSSDLFAKWQSYVTAAIEDGQTILGFATWIKLHHSTAPKYHKVIYLMPNERPFYKISFVDHLAHQGSNLLTCDKNLRGQSIPFALTINLLCEIYAIPINYGNDLTSYRQHHSSAVAGEDVLFAGEIYANNGTISEINDRSGHYKTDLYAFIFGLKWLQDRGASFNKARLIVNSWSHEKVRTYENAQLFLSIYFEAFEDGNYLGEVEDLNQALQNYKASGRLQPTYFLVKDQNEAFETYYDDNKVVTSISCTEKYNKLNVTTSKRSRALTTYDSAPRAKWQRRLPLG